MKAVSIMGSPRRQGSSARVIGEVHKALVERGWEAQTMYVAGEDIRYCTGCKVCEADGCCVQRDGHRAVMELLLSADLVIVASPSYWGDVTAQLKTFIDRCTPYNNNNSARKPLPTGIRGAAVAVRTGPNQAENLALVGTIGHFLGHLDIPLLSHLTVEGVSNPQDLTGEQLERAYSFGAALAERFAEANNH